MNELDSRAKALIDAAQEADGPLPADRARIKHALFLQIATIGAAASAASGAATAGTLSLAAKVGVAVLAVSVLVGGTVGVMKLRERHKTASLGQVEHAKTKSAPRVENPAAEIRPFADQVAAPPARAESKTRKTEAVRKLAEPEAEVSAEDQLNAEVAVLKRAREALRLGRPAQALRALADYDLLFGKGALREERQAMATIALCQIRPGPEAQAQADAFIRSSPNSPLLERVRAACIPSSPKNSP
jgi:hypothetical protein